jgi:hypothetical protein
MLAEGLEIIRNKYGTDFSEWDFSPEFKAFRKPVKIPCQLVIRCDQWVGNFERELIGYALGILDGCQMEHDFAHAQRMLFWKEVFNKDEPIEFEDGYELLDKYLLETFQPCDDWEQITFYNVHSCGNRVHSEIKIQFASLPPIIWRSIIIPRIKEFFKKYETTLTSYAQIVDLYFDIANGENLFYIKNGEIII